MARVVARRSGLPLIASVLIVAAGGLLAAQAEERRGEAPRRVVVDAGHGGADYGARGRSGLLEKNVVLSVAQRIGAQLEEIGFEVVYTRETDRFVTLPERTAIANRARADLYLSIHANASPDSEVRGPETYFLSLEASDDEARRVAMSENRVFDRAEAVDDSGDVVGAILGDLIRTEHLRGSSDAALAIQHELEQLPGPDRGVKQAPFVVLMGVNMPAALLEIGFLTNPHEERALTTRAHQDAIGKAVARAVAELPAPAHAAVHGGEVAE